MITKLKNEIIKKDNFKRNCTYKFTNYKVTQAKNHMKATTNLQLLPNRWLDIDFEPIRPANRPKYNKRLCNVTYQKKKNEEKQKQKV